MTSSSESPPEQASAHRPSWISLSADLTMAVKSESTPDSAPVSGGAGGGQQPERSHTASDAVEIKRPDALR